MEIEVLSDGRYWNRPWNHSQVIVPHLQGGEGAEETWLAGISAARQRDGFWWSGPSIVFIRIKLGFAW